MEELRSKLKDVICRGRRRPSVQELLQQPEQLRSWPDGENGTLDGSASPGGTLRIPSEQSIQSPGDSSPDEQHEPNFGKLAPDISWEQVTLYLHDDNDPTQGTLNLLLAKHKSHTPNHPLPTVVLLHGTSKDCTTPEMLKRTIHLARQNFLAVGLNSRHHGCRQPSPPGKEHYLRALVRAWRTNSSASPTSCTYPFIYDTAADLFSVADYLLSRQDVSTAHMGITGISLGGMHAWFAAAADTRWTAIAPLIGVQSFTHAVEHEIFHARVATIPDVFEAAAEDMRREVVCAEVVRAVWERICPGLLEDFDAAASLALLCPRPTFIGNGALDPRCPREGVERAVCEAREACAEAGESSEALELKVYEGVGHEVTEDMWEDVVDFFDRVFCARPEASAVAVGLVQGIEMVQ